MVIKRYNRPKLPRNHYNYIPNGGGGSSTVISTSSSEGGSAVSGEELEFIRKLKAICVVDSDTSTLKLLGDFLSVGDITAFVPNE